MRLSESSWHLPYQALHQLVVRATALQTLRGFLLRDLVSVLSSPLLTTPRGIQKQKDSQGAHLVLCQLPSDGAGLLWPQVQGQVLLQMCREGLKIAT